MEKEASQLERVHIHSVCEKIAPYFSDTRYKAWPKVQQFISQQKPGSLIADIVIHHFSREERRMRAIKEMACILRIGGQIMIYVWAMEQNQRRFEKQDVFVPWNPSPPSCSLSEPCSHGVQKSILYKDKELALNQACHKLDGTSEVHRTARISSRGGEKKSAMHSVREISEMVSVLKIT